MAIEIKLPPLGENIDSATVTRVLVNAGDKVSEGQAVVEVDTEKASVDVPADASGAVDAIRVKEGDVIKVGQVLLTLSDGKSAAQPGPAKPSKPEQPAVSKTPQAPREQQPDETPAQPPDLEKAEENPTEPKDVAVAPTETAPVEDAPGLAPASPVVRRMARELGVDINEVSATGPDGRITKDDVRNHARSIILNASASKGGAPSTPLPDFSRWGEIERKRMSGVRRKTAEHLQEAWSIPHVTHFDSADISELEPLRLNLSKRAERDGSKLTLTAIVLKVAASALKRFPHFNASVDVLHDEIVFKKYCHIGVAVDTERGLLVPVIRDVDKKNMLTLSQELTLLSEKARAGKLGIEEMQGGSFTMTNLGGIGGTNFTPIINSPEIAILGISRTRQQPVFVEGRCVPRLMLPLALSFDHRAIDGADAARFLRWIVEALEQPLLLAFEG